MIYGYMRVSTDRDQKLDLQEDALKARGCDQIFSDSISGSIRDRPGLKDLLCRLENGDTVVVWKIDRLGRSLSHLLSLLEDFSERGINFVSLTESFDTGTPMGKCIISVMGAFAELGRSQINANVKAGLAAAKARGVVFGRKNKIDAAGRARIRELLKTGLRVSEVASAMGVCVATVYNELRRGEMDVKTG